MSCYIKMLGLCLIAALAFSGLTAAGVSAGTPEAQLTVEGGGEVTITGESEGTPPVLTRGARAWSCETETLHGDAEDGDTNNYTGTELA